MCVLYLINTWCSCKVAPYQWHDYNAALKPTTDQKQQQKVSYVGNAVDVASVGRRGKYPYQKDKKEVKKLYHHTTSKWTMLD